VRRVWHGVATLERAHLPREEMPPSIKRTALASGNVRSL
jgi:hypothetical protein